jgi:hypothetical protein
VQQPDRDLPADGAQDERSTALVVEVLLGLLLRVERVHVDPLAVDVVSDEDAAGLGIHYEVQDAGPVAHDRSQVRAEVDHQEALDPRGALHLDPQRLPDAAPGPVRGDHVAAAHLVDLPAGEIAHSGRHAALVLLAAFPLPAVAEVDVGALLDGVGQDGLEAVLREVAQRRRRVAQAVLPLPLEREPPDLLARQTGHEDHVPRVGRILGGRSDRVHVEARLTADLERARVHDVRGGGRLGAAPPLYDEALPSLLREQDASDHADRAGADDEERNFDSRHGDS